MSSLDKSDAFTDLLGVQVRERPDATAMIFGDRATSYGELDQYSNRVANGLIGLGVEEQERIGYLGKNSDHYFALLLGATKAGAVLVPINWRLAPAEIATILADAGITLLFVGRGFGEVAGGLSVSRQLRCVSIDGANAEWPDYVAWRDEQSSDGPAVRVEAEHTFIQLYTAGTTGLPKGVELINRNFVGSVRAASQGGWGDWHPDDVILLCLPVSHIAASGLGLFGLAYGCTVVILEEVDPAAITESIAKHRVTTTLLVPAVIAMLVQHAIATRADFSSVRILAYGASPIADALIEQAQTVFSNAKSLAIVRPDRERRLGWRSAVARDARPGARQASILWQASTGRGGASHRTCGRATGRWSGGRAGDPCTRRHERLLAKRASHSGGISW